MKDDLIKAVSDPIKERLYQAVQKDGFIIRVGSNKTGHWEIMNNRHL